ncbi:MAG: glycosyltransferase family 2 protein [Lachnospiraceae bacterium]|nr:glycosyltransferase family 2 protein [Lachnospiraceae bacterium]
MGEPLVSVIVPVYNTQLYVERAVHSILNQTYKNIEVILVNDESTDDSEQVCKALKKKDQRIRYFSQVHQGVSAARNNGIRQANGTYLLFCDSDDFFSEMLVERVVTEFKHKNCDMVHFSCKSSDEELYPSSYVNEEFLEQKEVLLRYFNDSSIFRNMYSCCYGAYKSDIIKNNNLVFNEKLVLGEDGLFTLEYLMYCHSIKFISDELYIYVQDFDDRKSATAKMNQISYNEYELLCIYLKTISDKWDMQLTEEEKVKVYGSCYDKLIGRLVRLAAYPPFRSVKKNIRLLDAVINNSYVSMAGDYYRTKRKTDSQQIPKLMKKRKAILVWLMLRSKRKNYYKLYGKKKFGKSIWKDDDIVEYKVK